HDVLESDTELPWQVDARLDREGHTELERRVIGLDDVRLFVGFEADPVPGPVDEEVAIPALRDHVSSCCVDIGGKRTGSHGIDRGFLCGADEIEDFPLLGGRTSHDEGPGRVGAVALYPTPEVHHDEIAIPDLAFRRLVVR